MFDIFDSCDVVSVTKILIEQIEAICISLLTCLCSGFPTGMICSIM